MINLLIINIINKNNQIFLYKIKILKFNNQKIKLLIDKNIIEDKSKIYKHNHNIHITYKSTKLHHKHLKQSNIYSKPSNSYQNSDKTNKKNPNNS